MKNRIELFSFLSELLTPKAQFDLPHIETTLQNDYSDYLVTWQELYRDLPIASADEIINQDPNFARTYCDEGIKNKVKEQQNKSKTVLVYNLDEVVNGIIEPLENQSLLTLIDDFMNDRIDIPF